MRAVARICVESATQLEAGARGNRTFLDDEFRRTCFGGNLPCDVIDCGEIGFAVFLRRSADANKNRVTLAEGFASIGGVRDLARFTGRFQHLIQVMLVDGNFAGVQFRNPININVRADNVMTCLSQASASNQPYVPTANDTKIQGASPRKDSKVISENQLGATIVAEKKARGKC